MLRKTAKAIARTIPSIDRLIRQRDELLREAEQRRGQADGPQRDRKVREDRIPVDRFQALTGELNLKGLGLEIGPAYSPLLPKAAGYNVETLDFIDADQLREKFRNTDLDISRIEDIDYVTGGRSILDAIGKTGRYDFIVASHVVEHIPDLLGFLKDCERLLKPTGRLSLAVPDKRFCFDVFQGISTTGQMLQAHADRASRPSPAVLFDYIANYGKRGDKIAWTLDDETELRLVHDLTAAKSLFDQALSTTDYVDAHVWRFVPASFRMIIADFFELAEIGLRERQFVETGQLEFFVTLSRNGNGCPFDRVTLAKQAMDQQAELSTAIAPT